MDCEKSRTSFGNLYRRMDKHRDNQGKKTKNKKKKTNPKHKRVGF